MEDELVHEFSEFQVELESGSALLGRLRDLAVQYELTAAELSEDWMAFATQQGSRELTDRSCDEWATTLASQHKTKGHIAKKKSTAGKQLERKVHTKNDFDELFDDDLIGQYGTEEDVHKCGIKRSSETTPPASGNKMRPIKNGATPTTPWKPQASTGNHGTTPGHNGFVAGTPTGTYAQRKNSGATICSLNERVTPTNWSGRKQEVKVARYDVTTALTAPYHYMFQTMSDKALALLERTEQLGAAICHHHNLSDPLSVSQPSLEPAVYVGHVVCDGEGHLNASSCLLEGPVRSRTFQSHCVRLEIPPDMPCSLFPGQVVVVEGVNNYSGSLIPSALHDEGVYPPLPDRPHTRIGGFTAVVAAGPFSTCDSLDMTPLSDLITRVKEERPNILLLMGPFVDVNNSIVKTGCLPDDMTLQDFFSRRVLQPLLDCVSSLQTQLLLMPSQRDAHHPHEVYPQPPFLDGCLKQLKRDKSRVLLLSDPCTLSINGVCVGATSTDILFHLSARTMFRGPSGDRMAKLAGHILRQQCYYPLVPPYHREDSNLQIKAESNVPRPPSEACEINLDYVQAFEECGAVLPARPDLLILPSDLWPFVKALDGCVCVNPGHLTRKITGGTFLKLVVPELPAKPDLTSDIALSVIHI